MCNIAHFLLTLTVSPFGCLSTVASVARGKYLASIYLHAHYGEAWGSVVEVLTHSRTRMNPRGSLMGPRSRAKPDTALYTQEG